MMTERLRIAHLRASGLSGFASILSRRESDFISNEQEDSSHHRGNDLVFAAILRRQVGHFLMLKGIIVIICADNGEGYQY